MEHPKRDSGFILIETSSPSTAETVADPSRGAIREIAARALDSAIKVPVTSLVANFETFFQNISGLLDAVPDPQSNFRIEEIEFAAEITGEGELKLIGGVKAGLKGGITIKLRRQPSSQAPHA
jgi:hypothetical protein